jgi:hypothetical protein
LAAFTAIALNLKNADGSTRGLGQKVLDVAHDFRDALLFFQDVGGESGYIPMSLRNHGTALKNHNGRLAMWPPTAAATFNTRHPHLAP